MEHHKISRLIQKYDRAVPRYTSFPTAVQFHDGYDRAAHHDDLAGMQDDEPVSLYVHIPFCDKLCHYCGCHTKIVSTVAPINAYVEALCEEIRLARLVINKKLPVSRLHFGGGSPNYAPLPGMQKIMETLRTHFDFTAATEIDMECDPRLLNEDKIAHYVSMGLRRISLGIQDFDLEVQKAVNRVQPFELVEKQVDALRRAGVNAINFDLIIGLPLQSMDTVRQTLDQVQRLRPDRIAVFGYAHVPWMKKHQLMLEKFPMPGPMERFEMTMLVRDFLQGEGYLPIGIDHFGAPHDTLAQAARDKTMKRNFQGYTDDKAQMILAFGLSSISQLRNGYAQNTTDAPAYRAAIEAGQLPLARGLTMTDQDHHIRDLIMQLMCDFTLNMKDHPHVALPYERLAPLEQDGLVLIDGQRLTITEDGRPFTRVVAACFDPYYQPEAGRHAKAV